MLFQNTIELLLNPTGLPVGDPSIPITVSSSSHWSPGPHNCKSKSAEIAPSCVTVSSRWCSGMMHVVYKYRSMSESEFEWPVPCEPAKAMDSTTENLLNRSATLSANFKTDGFASLILKVFQMQLATWTANYRQMNGQF